MLKKKNRIIQARGEANLIIIVIVTGFAAVMIVLFAAAVFVNHVNSILYTIKVDMFMINRSAIIALNKDAEAKGMNSINQEEYLKFFRKALQENYGLNEQMESGNKLIERIDIINYDYCTSNEPVIKTEIGVKVIPIVFKKAFKDIFYFKIKQSVKVRKVLK
ncbi:MAG: hypothetical protein ACM3KR_05870 [Deltaproteobacteria bacterium]